VNERLLLPSDVARELGMSSDGVRDLERRGKLRAQRTLRGVRLFRARDVGLLKQKRAERRAQRETATP